MYELFYLEIVALSFRWLLLTYDSIIDFVDAVVPYTEPDITVNETDIYRT